MTDICTDLNGLCSLFSLDENFGDIHFITVFPGEQKSSPLARPVVAFGVKNMCEQLTGNVYDKSEPPVLLYNRKITARISIDIYVPQSMSGIDCYSIFTRIGNKLIEGSYCVSYNAAGCGDIKYDRDIGAFFLPAFVDIEEYEIK